MLLVNFSTFVDLQKNGGHDGFLVGNATYKFNLQGIQNFMIVSVFLVLNCIGMASFVGRWVFGAPSFVLRSRSPVSSCGCEERRLAMKGRVATCRINISSLRPLVASSLLRLARAPAVRCRRWAAACFVHSTRLLLPPPPPPPPAGLGLKSARGPQTDSSATRLRIPRQSLQSARTNSARITHISHHTRPQPLVRDVSVYLGARRGRSSTSAPGAASDRTWRHGRRRHLLHPGAPCRFHCAHHRRGTVNGRSTLTRVVAVRYRSSCSCIGNFVNGPKQTGYSNRLKITTAKLCEHIDPWYETNAIR